MNIKIEKNVPLPIGNGRGRRAIYLPTFDKMKPGDSFAVDADVRASLYTSFRQWRAKSADRKNLRITTAMDGDKARCWLLNGKAA